MRIKSASEVCKIA